MEAAQIWGSNPRAWAHPNVDRGRAREFGVAWREAGFGPLFIHSPYMVNVASPNSDFRRRSVALASATIDLAEQIQAAGVVVHAGAAGADAKRSEAIRLAARSLGAIARSAQATRVVIELTAGGTGTVASTFIDAADLLDAAGGEEHLALCADTCHLFAAGYALDSADGVAACFGELRRFHLARRLRLVHANDSKFARGARRDSHAHIGAGYIGEMGFRAILTDRTVRRRPVIIETPGRMDDDLRNIATLRRLASAEGQPPQGPGGGGGTAGGPDGVGGMAAGSPA